MGDSYFTGPLKSEGGFQVGPFEGVDEEIVSGDGEVKGLANVETLTASKILTKADSGKIFFIGTDALVITLPSTVKGYRYTFINIAADGAAIITISPAAADGIHGTITLAATVVELSGIDNKDLINTKASATTGNSVEIVGDGVIGWFVTQSTGIWASE